MTGRMEHRAREIRRRTRQYRQRYERRALSALMVCCLFLLAGIETLINGVQTPGVSSVEEGYGSVLLRNGASAYVLVGIAAFAAGVMLTVICIRYNRKKTSRTMGADRTEDLP